MAFQPKDLYVTREEADDIIAGDLWRGLARLQQIKGEYLEMMAAAYLKKTDLDPTEVELVEEQRGFETVFYYRRRRD